ncbi:Pkinase-domain-containing protein [Auriculariales sp. MPI-PUGE-AT-0066]|nr:Pkinase-domain-containing protein [Auriculariales sp. MPI-PUGE-AT-0066]
MSHNINAGPSINTHQHTHTNHNRQPQPRAHRETVTAVPSMVIDGDHVIIGDAHSYSERAWTQVKVVGEGSFGTVCLVDWHSPLPPGTRLSPMQCGAGARPEWNGKVLVALKKMTKPWDGGWDDCRKLKELQSLRSIPLHDNIIPLYDSFLIPQTKQLYFVFESMEGNVYQLIRSRKGRALAPGLVFSIFEQVVSGLHHIHSNGYFHRDMKPENLLVTTTGLAEYAPTMLQDVMVIVKIADFGLARETSSLPPYTDYVATRWYRAPEVLLRARDYSNPVDMWALGAILAELVNLKPLFPGLGEIDQVLRITQVLGEPTDRHGHSERGRVHGGGPWPKGIEMAESYGFMFRKSEPVVFATLFAPTVSRSLVDVIEDLLRYDPAARLKTTDLLDCEYVREMRAQPPPVPRTPQPAPPPPANGIRASSKNPASTSLPSLSPRNLPPSHSHSPHVIHLFPANGAESSSSTDTRRPPHYPQSQPAASTPQDTEMSEDYPPLPPNARARIDHMRAPPSPVPSSIYSFAGDRPTAKHDWNAMAVDDGPDNVTPSGSYPHHHHHLQQPQQQQQQQQQPQKGGLMSSFGFKKPLGRLFGGGGGGGKPDEDLLGVPAATSGLKRPQSSSNGPDYASTMLQHSGSVKKDRTALDEAAEAKRLRKEMKANARAEEKARRAIEEQWHRDQARAVMQKRQQLLKANTDGSDIDWQNSVLSHLDASAAGGGGRKQQVQQPQVVVTTHKEPPPQQQPPSHGQAGPSSQTLDGHHAHAPVLHHAKSFMTAASSVFSGAASTMHNMHHQHQHHHHHEPLPAHPGLPAAAAGVHRYSDDSITHRTKARRRETDDDHSNSDVQSISHISMISFATVDSDPGPTSGHRRSHGHRDRDREQHHYHVERHAPYPPTAHARDIERAVSAASYRTTTDHSQHSSFDFGSDYGGGGGGGGGGSGDTYVRRGGRLSSATSSSFAGGSPSPVLRPSGPPLSPPPMHALSLSNGQNGDPWRSGGSSSPNSPAALSRTSYLLPGGMSPIGQSSSINPMFQVVSPTSGLLQVD